MRLGEIYLLHAEALAMTGDLAGATEYVNKVRTRAGIKTIAVPSSQEAMIDAILKERRLELAFEGFRFFDLLRHGFERTKAIHEAGFILAAKIPSYRGDCIHANPSDCSRQ